MKKFTITTYVTLVASILFSILSVHFKLDVSFFAFPLSAAFTGVLVWALYFELLKKQNTKFLAASIKLLQYLPYVLLLAFVFRRAGKVETYYWYDIVTVLLWCAALIGRWTLLFWLNPKRISRLNPDWEKLVAKKSGGIIAKKMTVKGILYEIVDWIDAIVQAVFLVLLFQIFVFQLYVIPSESMVPSFLIKDRVVVFKTASGPKFPMSPVGLPCVKKYKRGDVVVFRNPQYGDGGRDEKNRQNDIRFVASQLIYMLSFTTININVDSHGQPKADPLVKRVCGVPGEQLVMQDGTLYARTKDSDEWKSVSQDNKFAAWNLSSLQNKYRDSIKEYPLNSDDFDTLLSVEEARRALDLKLASIECNSIYNSMASYVKNTTSDTEFSFDSYKIYAGFTGIAKNITTKDGYAWFKNYMTGWTKSMPANMAEITLDPYTEANYRLNVMYKLYSGRLFLRTAQLLAQGKDQTSFMQDEAFVKAYTDFRNVAFYISILDQRNMPVFPKNTEDGKPSYIPAKNYFMMGDNRFNSLDMRHMAGFYEAPLTAFDEYSVVYQSCLEQKYVPQNRILGTAAYRFWPLNRTGVVKTR